MDGIRAGFLELTILGEPSGPGEISIVPSGTPSDFDLDIDVSIGLLGAMLSTHLHE